MTGVARAREWSEDPGLTWPYPSSALVQRRANDLMGLFGYPDDNLMIETPDQLERQIEATP